MKRRILKRLLCGLLCLGIFVGILHGGGAAFAAELSKETELHLETAEQGQSQEKSSTRAFPNNEQYIDIPIEVLDFRGDGFLFEAADTFSTPYSLAHNSPSVGGISRPGTLEDGPTSAGDDFRIIGLVEDELYEGNVVYKEAVVEYIATALHEKRNVKSISGKMNGAFINKLTSNPALGDFKSTIDKAEPPVNGGVLFWKQVETCYDLAYYMLSSVWREVPRKDVLQQETRLNNVTEDVYYNLPVPELNHLRLYYIDNPESQKTEYAFNSYFGSAYENGYIFNTNTTNHGIDPSFRAMNGLGYEKSDYFGSNTEGRYLSGNYGAANYSFSIHAYGGFVYSESGDLYFTFSGDDDVYFYINNVLVCDVGGVHGRTKKSVNLNEVAADLNLKDGQICTFDMFYAERHTSGINMELYTNIQLMDTDVITGMQQYEAETGKKLVDGAAVNVGTPTAYSFSMLNRRVFPVKNVEFSDPTIGTVLTPEGITLNDKTRLSDIRITFRSYDRNSGKVYNGAETPASDPQDLCTKISAFFSQDNSKLMEDQAFSYQFTEEDTPDDLQALLALGIPAGCEMSIYGMEYEAKAGLFTNTVNSACIPISVEFGEDGSSSVVEQAPIPGTASCRIYGIDLGAVSVSEPLAVVIDYGKSVDIDVKQAHELVAYDDGMYSEFVGVTMNGEHGAIKTTVPTNLLGSPELPTGKGEGGSFTLSGDLLTYKPDRFLDTVDKCYGVFRLCASSDQSTIAYVSVEIQMIPANMVYYEAEDFTNEIGIVKKTTDSGVTTVQREWTEENYKTDTEGGSVPDYVQDGIPAGQAVTHPDYIGDDEVLFFSFDNRPEDQLRYQSAVYGGVNFDDPAEVNNHWFCQHWHKVERREIDTATGTLNLISKDLPGGEVIQIDQYPDLYFDTTNDSEGKVNPLQYNPAKAEVMQVRFKMKDLVIGTYYPKTEDNQYVDDPPKEYIALPYLTLQFRGNGNNDQYSANFLTNNGIHTDLLTGETYVTMRLRFNPNAVKGVPSFVSFDTINRLRIFFGGMEKNPEWEPGVLTVDYVYIGPESKAPLDTTYGWDYSYDNDSLLSNGKSLYVEGNGIWNVNSEGERDPAKEPANYTEASFSFTGTGFDLITRTEANQAALRIEIYEDHNRKKPIKTMTVQTKGELNLYQIPTVSVQDLDHGKYFVSVMVNNKVDSALEFLRRGNQLYLDAIRIYDPIDVSNGNSAPVGSEAAIAYSAYCTDKEAYPLTKEVRDILLTAKDFNALTTEVDGGIFVDYEEEPVETLPATDNDGENTEETVEVTAPGISDTIENHISSSVQTYEKVGPENEVYLGRQQALVFAIKVQSNELPERLDIGCKAIDGSAALLKVNLSEGVGDTKHPFEHTVSSATAQYYSVPLWKERFVEEKDAQGNVTAYYIYVMIQNGTPETVQTTETENYVLSITDLRIGYSQEPTPLTSGTTQVSAVTDTPQKRTSASSDVELPEDSFTPIRFVVDGSALEVADAILEDQYGSQHEHTPGAWHEISEATPDSPSVYVCFCEECGQPLEERCGEMLPALTFAGASVSLQSDLAIHYKVNESIFTEMGYKEPYVVIHDNGTEVILRDYVVKDGKYAFVYRNIAPHRIGDTITATLYAYYEDTLYCSASRSYSVAEYCYNMLGKVGTDDRYARLRTLLVDILHYGAKTQEYMSYRTDSLCNGALTEEQLLWGTESCRELVNHKDQAFKTIENPTVLWKGAGLNLRESIAIRFKIQAESYEDLEVRITVSGKTYSIYARDFDHRADGTYVHFRNINASQMSEPVYATVYRNGEQVSHTICYSIESYAYAKQNDSTPHLADLVKRMICYGDSTKAYVG